MIVLMIIERMGAILFVSLSLPIPLPPRRISYSLSFFARTANNDNNNNRNLRLCNTSAHQDEGLSSPPPRRCTRRDVNRECTRRITHIITYGS